MHGPFSQTQSKTLSGICRDERGLGYTARVSASSLSPPLLDGAGPLGGPGSFTGSFSAAAVGAGGGGGGLSDARAASHEGTAGAGLPDSGVSPAGTARAPEPLPLEWLLLIDADADLGGGASHARRGPAGGGAGDGARDGDRSPRPDTPFGLALLELQRALRNTGQPVTVLHLPAEGADLPSANTPTGRALRAAERVILVVAGAELESLLARCEQARTLRIGAQGAAVLACLLSQQEYLPAIIADAAERARGAGADDLLHGPPLVAELLTRASTVLHVAAQRRAAERIARYQQALQRAVAILCDDAPPRSSARSPVPREENAPLLPESESENGGTLPFYQIVDLARSTIGCAYVALCRMDPDGDGLVIVTTSHDSDQTLLSAPYSEYAELRTSIADRIPVLISDPAERARMCAPLRISADAQVLAVPLPVNAVAATTSQPDTGPDDAPVGWALLLYETRPSRSLLLDEPASSFVRSLAQLTALGVRGRQLDEALRDRTRRLRLGHLVTERPKQSLYHYREFFESSADGVIVLDERGRVVWLNRAAEQVTGYAAAGLAGHPLAELVPPAQREGLYQASEQVLAERKVPPYDMNLITTSRETLTLSVSTSVLLAEQQRYVVLAFRDVTEKRGLETELRKTKEFQERLIDSTVDGIIAADLRGRILLFNQGAARITGYAPDEVIGKLPVWQLYPDDDAREIMRQLRSDEFGGKGRLLQSRRTLVGKHGQSVPVALTASIIYTGDREVGTVGIVADLRDRLRIEQRLMLTEERLAVSEKQALVVELAGTAAHELNQPLTSMMGYAELLRRRLPEGYADILEYADILVHEAERMAEIVRKIGRITRYETKTYVGDARILDLDKSALPAESPSPDAPSAVSPLIGRPDSGPLSIDLRDAPLFQAGRSSSSSPPRSDDD